MNSRIIKRLLMILTLVSCFNLHATPGPLVTVIGTGGGDPYDVNVWLNGYSPLSGQRFHVISGRTLIITPTHPTHNYPAIGIEVFAPAMSIKTGCSHYVGNRCITSASNAAPARFTVATPACPYRGFGC